MATSMYEAFKKYILFQQDFMFSISLYFIFNEENSVKTVNNELKFVLTYDKFKKILIKLRNYAKNSCGVVCKSDEQCQGHKTLEMLQEYDDFMFDAVERRAVFYKQVKFIKIREDNDPMFGYLLLPFDEIDLGWKTWSQRMNYLVVN